MTTVKLNWHVFDEGDFEVHVLPHFARKNGGSDGIANELYAFTGRVQRLGADTRDAGSFLPFKSAADVEFATPNEAIDVGLAMGRRIIAGEIGGLSVDDLK